MLALGVKRVRVELGAAIADTVVARIASVELRPRLRALVAAAPAAQALLADAALAADDLEAALVRIEASLRRATSVLGAVEQTGEGGVEISLRDAVATAAALVQCPVRWIGTPPGLALDGPRATTISRLATALSTLTARGATPPLEVAAHADGGTVELRLRGPGLTAEALAGVTTALAAITDGVTVRAEDDSLVLALPTVPA
jgi:hypothetical protein